MVVKWRLCYLLFHPVRNDIKLLHEQHRHMGERNIRETTTEVLYARSTSRKTVEIGPRYCKKVPTDPQAEKVHRHKTCYKRHFYTVNGSPWINTYRPSSSLKSGCWYEIPMRQANCKASPLCFVWTTFISIHWAATELSRGPSNQKALLSQDVWNIASQFNIGRCVQISSMTLARSVNLTTNELLQRPACGKTSTFRKRSHDIDSKHDRPTVKPLKWYQRRLARTLYC